MTAERKVILGYDGKPLVDKNGKPFYEDMYDDIGNEAMSEEMYKHSVASRKPKDEAK